MTKVSVSYTILTLCCSKMRTSFMPMIFHKDMEKRLFISVCISGCFCQNGGKMKCANVIRNFDLECPTSQLWNLHSHAIFQCNAKPAWSPNEINLRPPIRQWPDISEQGAHACAIDIVILTSRCGAGMHFCVCVWTKCACLVCPYTGSATYKLCRVLLCHLLHEECSSVRE